MLLCIRQKYSHPVSYSQSKSSVHDKLQELHSNFPPIAQRTPSIITSSCWKSTVSDIRPSCIDWKKRCAQNVTGSFAQLIRNEYDQQLDVIIIEGVLWAIGGKWECYVVHEVCHALMTYFDYNNFSPNSNSHLSVQIIFSLYLFACKHTNLFFNDFVIYM